MRNALFKINKNLNKKIINICDFFKSSVLCIFLFLFFYIFR